MKASRSTQAGLLGIDLFAGCGGMSLGAALAGIRVELAIELDAFAAMTYARNHPTTKVAACDIRSIQNRSFARWKSCRDHLVVFGGPPCQGFSWSNQRTRGSNSESVWLFEEYLRVVRVLRPAWVVFENVQGITNTEAGQILTQIKAQLGTEYSLHEALLNAQNFGVPQDRTRYFLIGSRVGTGFCLPEPACFAPPTVGDALRDLPTLSNGADQCWRPYGRTAPSAYGKSLRRRAAGCRNHLVTRNATFVINRYRYVPQGGNWESIPPRLMKNYSNRERCHTGIYHRLRNDAPSIVIGNYRKNMLIHPTQDRGLSVREAARIQSFPDSYVFHGSIGFQQQQVGNAVPPLLAKAVFNAVTRAFIQ